MTYIKLLTLLIFLLGESSKTVAPENLATLTCLVERYTLLRPTGVNLPANNGGATNSRTQSTPPHALMPSANGKFLQVDGAPFLPFGLYHVSWAGRKHGLLLADLQTIGQAGFNILYAAVDLSDEAVLEKAQELGVQLLLESYDAHGTERVVNAFAQQPAVLGWLLADDFNAPAHAPRISPADLCNRHQQIKWLAPQHLTYVSGGGDPAYPLRSYNHAADIMGIQSYPISNLSGHFESALEQNYGYYCHARQALPGQTMLANVQTFRWQRDDATRYPTPAELRNMVYGALMNGANGILAYTYYDQGGLLPENNPALWTELVQLQAEIEILAPDLLYGTRQSDDIGPCTPLWKAAGVHAVLWKQTDTALLAVINTSNQQAEPVQLDLTQLAYQRLTAVFADDRYEDSLVLQNHWIKGTIAPGAVQLYRLDQLAP